MTSTADARLADATVTALRSTHDQLAAAVAGLDDARLLAPSGASEWSVAQVLSHLGSGAEIGLATVRAATGEADPPGDGFNQSVWDRWNGMSPREQAEGFLGADEALVAVFESLTPEQRSALEVPLAFLPAPLPLATYAGLRLNEAAQHSWDARVGLDDGATIPDDTAALLVEHLAGGLGFLLTFSTRPDELAEPAVVALDGLPHALAIDDTVGLVPAAGAPSAVLTGSPDAVARLVSGRLTPRWTPTGVSVTGAVTLDDLRRVFPGY